jgi:hypothetical protein
MRLPFFRICGRGPRTVLLHTKIMTIANHVIARRTLRLLLSSLSIIQMHLIRTGLIGHGVETAILLVLAIHVPFAFLGK